MYVHVHVDVTALSTCTCMFCFSPSSLSYDDTHNTLKYANRAKNIKANVSVVPLHFFGVFSITLEVRLRNHTLVNHLSLRVPCCLFCFSSAASAATAEAQRAQRRLPHQQVRKDLWRAACRGQRAQGQAGVVRERRAAAADRWRLTADAARLLRAAAGNREVIRLVVEFWNL